MLDEESIVVLAGRQTNTFDDDVDKGPVQDMAQNKDNIFQADQCDASDSDCCEKALLLKHLFMDQSSPSADLFMMLLDHIDNKDQFVHNDVSYVPNDAIMIITNDIYEQDAQCVTSNKPNNTVNASLIAELARYKELSKQKQVQPALYNGHEIVKTNHARALVHDSEDTLEIAETTRKQMIEKMKDPKCVKKKVKIASRDYSKENYLVIFTPQKQLTREQIFWSDDLLKMKAKALKEKAKSAKPITAMTVYLPNTPAKLVPKVLPTKSQVQVNIYSLV
ncbi:hypothetical protein Tco_0565794 [Tanacetum coccineum]